MMKSHCHRLFLLRFSQISNFSYPYEVVRRSSGFHCFVIPQSAKLFQNFSSSFFVKIGKTFLKIKENS